MGLAREGSALSEGGSFRRSDTDHVHVVAPAARLESVASDLQRPSTPSSTVSSRTGRTPQVHRGKHRPTISFDSLAELSLLPLSPSAWLRHGAEQVVLLARLAWKLWSYLGVGWRWLFNFYRLILYAMLLLPGFIQIVIFYVFSGRVIKSIPYGRQPRQRLDLYLPRSQLSSDEKFPVVIFITGGAWTIGYKAWGALLARRLSHTGVVVACLDYRNFPQGSAMQMLEDVNTGISWVSQKIHRYYGDPDNIVLVGQSAGGHLGAMALFRQVEQSFHGRATLGADPSWSPRDVRAFVGVSGAFDLEGLAEHLHRRGLYKSLFTQIMSVNGLPAIRELSPLHTAQTWTNGIGEHLPEVLLIHGTSDKSVPHSSSSQLHEALLALNARSTLCTFEGKGHTSFLIEDPMCGGRDVLMDLVLEVVTGRQQQHHYPALCPWVLCRMAAWVCPF